MLEIRKAKSEDAQLIALLGTITFSETFEHLFTDIEDLYAYKLNTFSVAKIESSLGKKGNIYWLAYFDNLPVGYAKLKLNSSSEFLVGNNICQLQKIYVLRDYLSKKIGHQLQSKLIEEARKQKFQKVWLSVLESNSRAISFYKKNEFEMIGHHDFQIGKENFSFYAMAKNLPESKKS